MAVLARPIVPHLWFDTQAHEAATFSTEVCPESRIDYVTVLHDTPSRYCDVLSFTLWNQMCMATRARPYYTINPSVSFFVNFDEESEPQAREKLDILWGKLADGGQALMDPAE